MTNGECKQGALVVSKYDIKHLAIQWIDAATGNMTTRLFNDEDDEVWLSFNDDSCLLIPRRDFSLGDQSPVEAIHWSPSGALVVLEPGFKRVSLVHNCTQRLIGPLKTWQDKRNKFSINSFVSPCLFNTNGCTSDWESVRQKWAHPRKKKTQ